MPICRNIVCSMWMLCSAYMNTCFTCHQTCLWHHIWHRIWSTCLSIYVFIYKYIHTYSQSVAMDNKISYIHITSCIHDILWFRGVCVCAYAQVHVLPYRQQAFSWQASILRAHALTQFWTDNLCMELTLHPGFVPCSSQALVQAAPEESSRFFLACRGGDL